jgi:hypothetical protein
MTPLEKAAIIGGAIAGCVLISLALAVWAASRHWRK